MKWLHKIGDKLKQFAEYLQTFGAAGLFAIALLDSAFVPMAGGPDAVMLLLSIPEANHRWVPLYAVSATVGSVIGCLILYYISKRAGRSALEKFSEEKQARVKALVDKYDVLSVLVASVLPPPFPFKLFVITAGVFRLSVARFAVAVAVGRAFRYFLEGYLAVTYGEKAGELLKKNYPAIGLGVAALVVVVFVLRAILKRRGKGEAGGGRDAGQEAAERSGEA